jgi:hypothetical protein
MTEPAADARVPECWMCSGTLLPDDAGWYCEQCGLRYKFVTRYRDDAALARARATVQDVIDLQKGLQDALDRMNCRTCRDLGVAKCPRHKKPPSA